MKLKKFCRSTSGNFLTTFAIASPVLLGVAGLALDVSTYVSQQSLMQETADTAVLAAIREAAVAGWDTTVATTVVEEFIASQLEDASFANTDYTDIVKVDPVLSRIKVTIQQNGHGYLLLSLWKNNPQIEVSAEAQVASSANICVLTLNENKGSTLKITGKSTITGQDCGVFGNSADKAAMEVEDKATLTAQVVCTAGGYSGPNASYNPDPVTDCPTIPDPLASRAPPPVGSCDYYDTDLKGSITLNPGVYCGGIKAGGNSKVTLNPGIYVIKDGEFTFTGNATLEGENVGIYITGSTAKVAFDNSTTISLTAPKSGSMAGILFFEDRNSPDGREFEISSKDARQLLGTIYFPKGFLSVKGNSKFADASAWTAIIATEIRVENGPSLVLNSDYKASDIPVPAGISAETGKISLIK